MQLASRFTRCLDIRRDYAIAKLTLQICHSDAIEKEKLDAVLEAYNEGFINFNEGMPFMFCNEIELAHAWNEGQNCAVDYEEMKICSYCNDGTGNPCIFHG